MKLHGQEVPDQFPEGVCEPAFQRVFFPVEVQDDLLLIQIECIRVVFEGFYDQLFHCRFVNESHPGIFFCHFCKIREFLPEALIFYFVDDQQ